MLMLSKAVRGVMPRINLFILKITSLMTHQGMSQRPDDQNSWYIKVCQR